MTMVAERFVTVTELPGSGATPEQLAMLYTRYRLAAEVSRQKDVLEVACGPGIGLGYLARHARKVVGGDYDLELLRLARAHYRDRMPLLQLDAHALPFPAQSFDVVILFEALYYLVDPERFTAEVRRVLRPHGTIVVSTVNVEWPGFNPSPFSRRYFSAAALEALLASHGFYTDLYGGFPATPQTYRQLVLGRVRRLAVHLRLIPPTMKGKELLKRIVYGRLMPLPRELQDGVVEPSRLVRLEAGPQQSVFKVLYAVGQVHGTA